MTQISVISLSDIHGTTVTTYPYGSDQVWSGNVTEFLIGSGAPVPAKFVANLTASICLNGARSIPATNLIPAADCQAGVIWRTDGYTGVVEVASNDTLLRNTSAEGLDVNGVHVQNRYVFSTNTDLNLHGRVPINKEGIQTGPVKELVSLPYGGVYDFALFGVEDWAILAGDPSNGIYFVTGVGDACVLRLNEFVRSTALKIQYIDDRGAVI